MTLEKALFYLTHHSEAIIQWLFLVILLLAMIIVGRGLFAKKKLGGLVTTNGADAGELQSFLQTILERTSKLESVSVQGMDKAGLSNLEAQIQTLKKDLAARESEIAAMAKGGPAPAASAGGASASSSGGAIDAGEMTKLSARIAELEAKLAEYEILEDDIADLSLYKEENARMRTELDTLKASPGAPAPAAAPAAAPAPSSAQAEAIMNEFEQAAQTEPVKSTGEAVKIDATGDSLNDFEATVNLAKKMSGEETPAAAPAPAAAVAESDDLFAEFAGTGETAEDALDTSKVMDELTALESLADGAADGASALDETIDTDKMAAEATSLTKS